MGVTGQRKAKPLGFIFSHIFQLIRMKYDKVLNQIQAEVVILLRLVGVVNLTLNFEGSWYTVETCWCDEPHTEF